MNNTLKKNIYTIGYSGFPEVKDFIAKLKEFKINVLIDVRSSPYSSYYTQYDREQLEMSLKSAGIYYRNYAKEFGARQEDRQYYKDGVLNFSLFSSSKQFEDGEKKVDAAISAGFQPALMCAEKNPTECHRAIMVGKRLSENQFNVVHLMPGNAIKTQDDIGTELLNCYYPDRNQFSLFGDIQSDDVLIEDAYRLQNRKIGFHEEDLLK